MVYDFDNNFINSFPVKEEFNRMQFIENGKLLINRTNMYGALENKLSLIDSMGNILKSYPNYYNFTPQANMVIMVGESNVNKNFYTTTEGILYKGEYSDSIYSFDEDYNLNQLFFFILGNILFLFISGPNTWQIRIKSRRNVMTAIIHSPQKQINILL